MKNTNEVSKCSKNDTYLFKLKLYPNIQINLKVIENL
jgi:hypothetical protein